MACAGYGLALTWSEHSVSWDAISCADNELGWSLFGLRVGWDNHGLA
jgi:hypothetical protein